MHLWTKRRCGEGGCIPTRRVHSEKQRKEYLAWPCLQIARQQHEQALQELQLLQEERQSMLREAEELQADFAALQVREWGELP